MNLNDMGASLRAARKDKGLTQIQVCAAVTLSRKTLSSLETGKIHELGVRKLLALCTLFDLQLTVGPNAPRTYPTLQELRAQQARSPQTQAR